MNSPNIVLVWKKVKFCAQFDKDAFFEWIKKIDCIEKYYEKGNAIYLEIVSLDLHDYNLRDLLALFNRYNMDMKQLAIFLNDDNKKWFFYNKRTYWFKRVFGPFDITTLHNRIVPKTKPILICKSVKFNSLLDEETFFEWIKKIKCIKSFSKTSREISLHILSNSISDEDLDDILGIFYRYKIDMKQLAVFLNDDNKKWFFEDTKAYWHKKVFVSKKKE